MEKEYSLFAFCLFKAFDHYLVSLALVCYFYFLLLLLFLRMVKI